MADPGRADEAAKRDEGVSSSGCSCCRALSGGLSVACTLFQGSGEEQSGRERGGPGLGPLAPRPRPQLTLILS